MSAADIATTLAVLLTRTVTPTSKVRESCGKMLTVSALGSTTARYDYKRYNLIDIEHNGHIFEHNRPIS